MQGRKGSQTYLEKYRYTPPTKSAITTSGRKMAAAMWAASGVLEAAGALATENTEGGIGAELPVTWSPHSLHLCSGVSSHQLPPAGWGQGRSFLLFESRTSLFLPSLPGEPVAWEL